VPNGLQWQPLQRSALLGKHHLIEIDHWPDGLPAVVLDAVGRAPRINDDQGQAPTIGDLLCLWCQLP